MPVADGWIFLRERNSNPELETIPVIVLSGQPDVEEQVIAAHASYLRKPFSREHLTEVYNRLCAEYGSRSFLCRLPHNPRTVLAMEGRPSWNS
jgi:CheY-like chemotaxis protein